MTSRHHHSLDRPCDCDRCREQPLTFQQILSEPEPDERPTRTLSATEHAVLALAQERADLDARERRVTEIDSKWASFEDADRPTQRHAARASKPAEVRTPTVTGSAAMPRWRHLVPGRKPDGSVTDEYRLGATYLAEGLALLGIILFAIAALILVVAAGIMLARLA